MPHASPWFPILLAASLLLGCAAQPPRSRPETSPQATAPRGFILRELPASQGRFAYAVYVPRGYDASKPWPCLLFLHGQGESGKDGLKQCIQGIGSAIQWNQAEWPCIVLLPQKPESNRQWEDYDPQLMSMLADARAEWNIDPRQISITGLSQGGHGTWTIAAAHPHLFAALAPICGYARPASPADLAARIGDAPVWAFHGLADDVVPPAGTTAIIDALRARRTAPGAPEVRLSLFEGVNHGSWDRAYRNEGLAAWLLAQRRAEPGVP